MKNGITFNEVHSSSFGLELLSSKRLVLPENKDSYIDIPEKNGSILIADETSRDINIEVDFKLFKRTTTELFEELRAISSWLSTSDRKMLIFDDDPNYYYMAKVTGNIPLEKVITIGKFTVNFRCLPYAQKVNEVEEVETV